MPRRRKEHGPWFWRSAIALMLSSVFALFAAAAMYQPPATDSETNCRLDRRDPAHTIVLVDQSDPFDSVDLDWVYALLEEEARGLERYGRLSVAVPNSESPYDPQIVFSACSPGSAAAANPLWQNPRMVEQAWANRFREPLVRRADEVLKDTVAPSSPLMEAIFTLAARPDFKDRDASRRMVIVSDLIQHSRDFSMYRNGADYDAYQASALERMRPQLEGVAVTARIMPRPQYDLPLSEVKLFWQRWFDETGARYGSLT